VCRKSSGEESNLVMLSRGLVGSLQHGSTGGTHGLVPFKLSPLEYVSLY
jgi:hypothetical protein